MEESLTVAKVYGALREVCVPQDVLAVMDRLTGHDAGDFPNLMEMENIPYTPVERNQIPDPDPQPEKESKEEPEPKVKAKAKAKKKPEPEPEPEPEQKKEKEHQLFPPTLDDVRAAIIKLNESVKETEAIRIIGEVFHAYDAKSLSEISPEFFGDVVADLEDAIGA